MSNEKRNVIEAGIKIMALALSANFKSDEELEQAFARSEKFQDKIKEMIDPFMQDIKSYDEKNYDAGWHLPSEKPEPGKDILIAIKSPHDRWTDCRKVVGVYFQDFFSLDGIDITTSVKAWTYMPEYLDTDFGKD